MDDAEKLLRNWQQSPPRDGVKCEDALKVIRFLGMEIEDNNEGHYEASHPALLGTPQFPYGSLTVNCHAFGKQGKAHPKAILDIRKAAKIIQAAQQKEQDHEDDSD